MGLFNNFIKRQLCSDYKCKRNDVLTSDWKWLMITFHGPHIKIYKQSSSQAFNWCTYQSPY